MSIEILRMPLGPLQTNCYLVADSDTRDAIVIDPVDRADLIRAAADERGWTVREILATHCHFDHVMASAELKEQTGAPFCIHVLDLPMLNDMPARVKAWFGVDVPAAAEPDSFVQEGDTISAGGITLEVLFTPGHAPGHVSYVLRSQEVVFSGDVLFLGGIGRTDFPNASYEDLMESIVHKLLPLGDEYTVATGHGQTTTIGRERQYNPFIADYLASRSDQ